MKPFTIFRDTLILGNAILYVSDTWSSWDVKSSTLQLNFLVGRYGCTSFILRCHIIDFSIAKKRQRLIFVYNLLDLVSTMDLKFDRNGRIRLYFRPTDDNGYIPSIVADDSVVTSVNLPFECPKSDESVLLIDRVAGNAQQAEMYSKKKARLNHMMMQFGYQAHALCMGFVFGATVEDRLYGRPKVTFINGEMRSFSSVIISHLSIIMTCFRGIADFLKREIGWCLGVVPDGFSHVIRERDYGRTYRADRSDDIGKLMDLAYQHESCFVDQLLLIGDGKSKFRLLIIMGIALNLSIISTLLEQVLRLLKRR